MARVGVYIAIVPPIWIGAAPIEILVILFID